MTSKADLDDARIEASFKKFDADGSGAVSKSEVKAVLADMGLESEDVDSITNTIMEEADANDDAKLTLQEFKTALGK